MDGYGKRVLVVDDDDNARRFLAGVLECANYNVHLAADGLEALYEMKKRHFDAVITDYHMPRMNGMEFLVLSQVIWPNTPIVFLSSNTEDLADVAVERGAFTWVHRPYETQHVLSVLRSAMQQSPQDRWKQTLTRLSC